MFITEGKWFKVSDKCGHYVVTNNIDIANVKSDNIYDAIAISFVPEMIEELKELCFSCWKHFKNDKQCESCKTHTILKKVSCDGNDENNI